MAHIITWDRSNIEWVEEPIASCDTSHISYANHETSFKNSHFCVRASKKLASEMGSVECDECLLCIVLQNWQYRSCLDPEHFHTEL